MNIPLLFYDIISLNSSSFTITEITGQNIIQIKQLINCSAQNQMFTNQLCVSSGNNLTFSFKVKNDKYLALELSK